MNVILVTENIVLLKKSYGITKLSSYMHSKQLM